jgi:hypothetical protein
MRRWVSHRAGLNFANKEKSLAPKEIEKRFLGVPTGSLHPVPTDIVGIPKN